MEKTEAGLKGLCIREILASAEVETRETFDVSTLFTADLLGVVRSTAEFVRRHVM